MRKLYGRVTDTAIHLQSTMAGVQGEAGATALVLSFSEGWSTLGKRLLFFDSHHENPISVLLGVNRLYGDDTSTYIVPIPYETLAFPGDCLLFVEGTVAGSDSVMRTLTTHLHIYPAPASEAKPFAETEAIQLQAEIDAIKETLLTGLTDAVEVEGYAVRAETAAAEAESSAETALAASRNCLLATGDSLAACYQGKLTVPLQWTENEEGVYVDLAAENALSTDSLFAFVPKEKYAVANEMGLSSCESKDGAIRLSASKPPKESFTMTYTLLRGVISV